MMMIPSMPTPYKIQWLSRIIKTEHNSQPESDVIGNKRRKSNQVFHKSQRGPKRGGLKNGGSMDVDLPFLLSKRIRGPF